MINAKQKFLKKTKKKKGISSALGIQILIAFTKKKKKKIKPKRTAYHKVRSNR